MRQETLGTGTPDFWKTVWPTLIQRSIRAKAKECFFFLATLPPAWDNRPLPALTLAWMIRAAKPGDGWLGTTWMDAKVRVVAELLAATPQTLQARDWLLLVGLGGPSYFLGNTVKKCLLEAPWYRQGWHAWCNRTAHHGPFLDAVVSMGYPVSSAAGVLLYLAMAEELPRNGRLRLSEQLSEKINIPRALIQLANGAGAGRNYTEERRIMHWAAALTQAEIPLKTLAHWREWFQGVMAQMGSTSLGLAMVPLLMSFQRFRSEEGRAAAPTGIAWTENQAIQWANTVSFHLMLTPQEAQGRCTPMHKEAVLSLLQLDTLLDEWGLLSSETVRAFDRAMGEANPAWQEVIRVMVNTEKSGSTNAPPALWRAWTARRLNLTLFSPTPSRDERRPRL